MHIRESFGPGGIAEKPRWSPVAHLVPSKPTPPLLIAILRHRQPLAYRHRLRNRHQQGVLSGLNDQRVVG
jgi:hypothetical protein